MLTNETDTGNQQTDSRSQEQTQKVTQKEKANPKNPAANPGTQTDEQPKGKQNEPGTQERRGSTPLQSRTNTDVRNIVRPETETTEAKSAKRNQ